MQKVHNIVGYRGKELAWISLSLGCARYLCTSSPWYGRGTTNAFVPRPTVTSCGSRWGIQYMNILTIPDKSDKNLASGPSKECFFLRIWAGSGSKADLRDSVHTYFNLPRQIRQELNYLGVPENFVVFGRSRTVSRFGVHVTDGASP